VTTRHKKGLAGLAATMLIGAAVAGPSGFANPSPPTNGGNGGGKSGQCTGAAQDRPGSACASGNK
jgi:hypothetical protein